MLIEPARKIAVLRANSLGDFIFALPALASLRAAYPQAEIVYLGKPWHASLLQNRPSPVDRVIAVPPSQGVNTPADNEDPAELERFFQAMRAEHFDLALQMHGGGRYSNPFVLNLGAGLTVGLKTPEAPPLDRWIPYFYWQNEIARLLEVVRLVGATAVTLEPRLETVQSDIDESCAVAPVEDIPLAVIHPGASDSRRRWAAENFARVGDALVKAGCRVALVGIPVEAEIAGQVIEAMEEPALNLCGRLSLTGLTGLLRRARLVVANDSGPRHLAEALGTPTVGVYWCGNLINAGPMFREKQRPHLSWRIHCSVCGRNTLHDPCEHTASFVDEVTVDEVLEDALDLLRMGS